MLLIHQRNLHTFLLTLLPHEDDVDDLLQQVCLALWQKKDSYAPDRPFLPWAYAFARNHALKYLQQQSRDRQVTVFHGGLLERLAVAREAFDASADTRRQALAACLKQLRPEQRQLLEDRFAGTQTLTVVIRGMALSFTTAREQNTSVFLDGVYLQRQSMLNPGLYDSGAINSGPSALLLPTLRSTS